MSQELFDEAVHLEEQGQNEDALAIWRQLSEIKPTRNVFLRIGWLTQSLGIVDDAELSFKRALEIDGGSATALRALGILAIGRSDYETAVCYLQRAREIEEDPGGLSLLGVALRNTGKYNEAEEAYRTAIRIDSNYEEAHYNLGVLLRDDRPTEAQLHLRKALELDPVFAPAYRELGFVLMKQGTWTEAESYLQKAVELAPEDVWARIYLGAYFLTSDTKAAETEFRIAEKLQPEWSMPLSCMGKIYESSDLETAQSFFEQALSLQADDWEALCGMARIFNKRGQTDLARKYITRALLQDPTDKNSLVLLEGITSSDQSR